jgi:hypothetical protein
VEGNVSVVSEDVVVEWDAELAHDEEVTEEEPISEVEFTVGNKATEDGVDSVAYEDAGAAIGDTVEEELDDTGGTEERDIEESKTDVEVELVEEDKVIYAGVDMSCGEVKLVLAACNSLAESDRLDAYGLAVVSVEGRGTTTGELDSAGIVTCPKSESETVAGNVETVNVAMVTPFSRTS